MYIPVLTFSLIVIASFLILRQEFEEINRSISQLESDRQTYNTRIEKIEKSKKDALLYSREVAYWEFNDDYTDYKRTCEHYDQLIDKSQEYERNIEKYT